MARHASFRALIALAVVSLACSVGGGAGQPAATSTAATGPGPTGSPASPEPTETSGEVALTPEDIPPGDYYEALQERVETGEWTYEEGLLAILRAFAGRSDDPLGDVELGEREGTGIIREARQYLREGADLAVRTEIEELLAIIIPSPERLQPYSRPEGQSRNGSPGLASPVDVDPQCSQLYADGFPPGQSIVCYLVAQAPMGAEGVDVYYPADWASDPTSVIFSKAALSAVLDSWNVYKAFGGLQSVGVVFSLLPSLDTPTALAEVPSPGGDGPCLIVVYPLAQVHYNAGGSGASGIDGFKQTIAHEMFHCFQGWNYPDQFNHWSFHRWWGEGSAEYFGNVVYPTVNKEWGRYPSFAILSAELSIFQMAYQNTVFFQFLEDKIQPQGLISLFHLFKGTDPPAKHREVLSGYPGMAEYWHEFGRAVMDRKVVDTSGETVPASRLPEWWTEKVGITITDTYNMPATDFVLTRYDVALGGGLGYHVHVGQTDVEILHGARMMASPPWGPMAIDRPGGCARYAVLVTSTGASSTPRTFQANAVVDQPKEGGVCDTCVLGRWRMTHDSYHALYQKITEGAELPVSNMLTTGDLEMAISSDGTLLAEAMPFDVQTMGGIPDAQGDPIYTEINVHMSGTSKMEYQALEGEFLITMVEAGITTTSSVDIGGQVYEGLLEDMGSGGGSAGVGIGSGPPGATYHFTYTCSPTELQLTSIDPLFGGLPWIYKKIGQP